MGVLLLRRWESNPLPLGYEPSMQPLQLSAKYITVCGLL